MGPGLRSPMLLWAKYDQVKTHLQAATWIFPNFRRSMARSYGFGIFRVSMVGMTFAMFNSVKCTFFHGDLIMKYFLRSFSLLC